MEEEVDLTKPKEKNPPLEANESPAHILPAHNSKGEGLSEIQDFDQQFEKEKKETKSTYHTKKQELARLSDKMFKDLHSIKAEAPRFQRVPVNKPSRLPITPETRHASAANIQVLPPHAQPPARHSDQFLRIPVEDHDHRASQAGVTENQLSRVRLRKESQLAVLKMKGADIMGEYASSKKSQNLQLGFGFYAQKKNALTKLKQRGVKPILKPELSFLSYLEIDENLYPNKEKRRIQFEEKEEIFLVTPKHKVKPK